MMKLFLLDHWWYQDSLRGLNRFFFFTFVFLFPIFNMVVNTEIRSYNDEKTFPEVIEFALSF